MLLDLFSVEYSKSAKDTHDGGFKKHRYHESEEALKRRNLLLRKQEEHKLAERLYLRKELENARENHHAVNKINILDHEIKLIAKQIKLNETEYKKLKQEEDIHVILLTLH